MYTGLNRATAIAKPTTAVKGKDDQKDLDKARERAKMARSDDDDEVQDEVSATTFNAVGQSWFGTCFHKLKRKWDKNKPLMSDVTYIEARYGTSVGAYFKFFRWIFNKYTLMFTIALIFMIIHLVNLGNAQSEMSQAKNFDMNYLWQSSDWGNFDNVIPRAFLYSSFNPGTDGTEETTYQSGERILYGVLVLLINMAFLFVSAWKWVSEDRIAKEAELEETALGKNKFSAAILGAWDHSKRSFPEVEDYMYFLGEDWGTMLTEEYLNMRMRSRSAREKTILLIRRATGLLLYILIQVGCGALILYITTQSDSLQKQLRSSSTFFQQQSSIAALIVSSTATIINSIFPQIIELIAKLENYDSNGTRIKLKIQRLFIARLLNTATLAISNIMLADPYLFRDASLFPSETSRLSMQKSYQPTGSLADDTARFSTKPYCRMDLMTDSMMTIILTDFFLSKIINFLTPFLKFQIAKLRKKPFIKAEFSVPETMVAMFNTQALFFMLIPFSPLSIIFFTLMLYVNFKFDYLILYYFQQKPTKPWSARDAGAYLSIFYLICVSLFTFLQIYFFINETFPKECLRMQEMETRLFPVTSPLFLSVFEEKSYWTNALNYTGSNIPLGYTALSRFANTPEITFSHVKSYIGYSNDSIVIDENIVYMCSMACGPFMYSKTAYAPLKELFLQSALEWPYKILLQTPLFVWILLLSVLLSSSLQKNTLAVQSDLYQSRQLVMLDEISDLEKKNSLLVKKLKRLESGGAHGGDVDKTSVELQMKLKAALDDLREAQDALERKESVLTKLEKRSAEEDVLHQGASVMEIEGALEAEKSEAKQRLRAKLDAKKNKSPRRDDDL
jgi:hypothetical protein